jgi:N-formylglutamate amidohydrolase
MELFKISLPIGEAVPIVANLPHSGLYVPEAIAATMTPEHRAALPNSDWHLDHLYEFLPQLGITVMQASHSRYVVDLNREVKDPVLGDFWTAAVPEKTAFGQPIYRVMPTQAEAQQRIEHYYQPYHAKLEAVVQEMRDRFGQVYFFDLHSFMGLITDDVCLGNRNGETCSEELIALVERAFNRQWYRVVKNKVFNGGFITKHYGQMPNVEALQIEVRYPVYLKESQLELPHPPEWDVKELVKAREAFEKIFTAIVAALR